MTRALVMAVVVSLGLAVSSEVVAKPSHSNDEYGGLAPLSLGERQALSSRQLVTRPLRFKSGSDGFYVGGVSYQVVHADPSQVLAALASAESLPRALPATLSATMLSREGRTARVELVQGKSPFVVKYTVVLEQAASGNAIRFWLDPTRPHGIRDVWGYFRVEEFGEGKSLLTVAAALDLGPGLTRSLFEDRVQRVILRTPSRIRSFVEPLAIASSR